MTQVSHTQFKMSYIIIYRSISRTLYCYFEFVRLTL